MSDGLVVAAWTEVTDVRDGVVGVTHHYGFPDGDELVSSASLRYRSEDELRAALQDAGFVVETVYGAGSGNLSAKATASSSWSLVRDVGAATAAGLWLPRRPRRTGGAPGGHGAPRTRTST